MGLLDVSMVGDYRVWDGTEPITYYHARRGAGGTGPDQENIALAKRRVLNKRELAASAGAYTGLDRVWLVPAPLIQGDDCKPGDTLSDQRPTPTIFTVLQADLQRNGNTWRLTTRDPIIAYNLRDVIDVQTPSNLGQRSPAAGQAVKTWATKYASLTCRMQPQDDQVADQRGIRGMLQRYFCYVADQTVTVTNEDRIAFGGNFFDITAVRSQETLTDLLQIECERRPGA